MPLPRPRRPLLDDRPAARARPAIRDAQGCWPCSASARRPGKTNLMAKRGRSSRGQPSVGRRRPTGDRLGAGHRGRARPRPAAGLQRPLRASDAARRADACGRSCSATGAPEEIEPLTRRRGGRLRRADRRAAETIHTLHSELRTFGDSFGCREASFRLCLSPDCSTELRELTSAPEAEVRRRAAEARAALGQTVSVHIVEASAGGRVGAGSRGHRADGARGAWAAASSRPPRRRPPRCGCSPAGRSRPAARFPPSAASSPDEMFAELERRGCRFEVTTPGGGAGVKVGVPSEVKADEYRVALTPVGCARARRARPRGPDPARGRRGQRDLRRRTTRPRERASCPTAEDVWGEADLVLKVKEPQPEEVPLMRARSTLFTYLHLAPAPDLTRGLCDSGATCVAYETVEDQARAGCRCWRR